MADSRERLEDAIGHLIAQFPNCGIVLFVTPLNTNREGVGEKAGQVAYIANVNRQDVLAMLEEIVARFKAKPDHRMH